MAMGSDWPPNVAVTAKPAVVVSEDGDRFVFPDDNPKTRYGVMKPSMSVVPTTSLIHLMRAMQNGADKYEPFNWRTKNVSSTIYYAAAMRHLMAWFDGEKNAADSGVHHLGHVMACCAIILDAEACETLNDDRPTPGVFAKLVEEFTAKNGGGADA